MFGKVFSTRITCKSWLNLIPALMTYSKGCYVHKSATGMSTIYTYTSVLKWKVQWLKQIVREPCECFQMLSVSVGIRVSIDESSWAFFLNRKLSSGELMSVPSVAWDISNGVDAEKNVSPYICSNIPALLLNGTWNDWVIWSIKSPNRVCRKARGLTNTQSNVGHLSVRRWGKK